MSKTIKLIKDIYDDGVNIFNEESVEITPGVTVLVGCNGFGKTTLLTTIAEQLDIEKIKYVRYNNLTDGGSNSINESIFFNDISLAAEGMCSSEGENININLGKFARKIGKYIHHTNQDEYWILLDGIDSGLSVDNIMLVKNGLFKTIIDDVVNQIHKNVYIVVSANEYELCYDENCLDVYNCEYVHFKTYDSYKKFILKTAEIKSKRYENT